MRSLLFLSFICITVVSLADDRPTPGVRDLPGVQPDGSVLLPNQWWLRPVGKQVQLGDLPSSIALHPGGKFAAVLHCGHGSHEVVVVDISTGAIVSRVAIEESFQGIAFTRDGGTLFVSGSSQEVIHRFAFADGYLSQHATIALRDVKKRGIPCGLAVTADGKTIYAANVWGQSVTRTVIGAAGEETTELLLTEAAAPAAPEPLVSTDDPSITKRAQQLLDVADPSAPFPYACLLDEKRSRLYVSLWAQAAVAVIDTKAWKVVARWKAEDHPNEMALTRDGARLFVANANRNSVSVIDTATGTTVETLVAELAPGAEPGNTPNALALSPDETRLFVANANINTVAVFDIATPREARSLGFIPVGWYPTSVRVSTDGKKLLVANGKGAVSRPNRNGPQPGRPANTGVREYIGELFPGTLSIIELPEAAKFEAQMKTWSARALSCSPTTALKTAALSLDGNPIPQKLGDPSPIKYCIYIIKENRTYDQVLGDMKEGNGDPSICLFDERITPNHHALAREFVLLDNFYVESEVSADGHEWTMGAYATDFVEKSWPLNYGHGKSGKFPYPSEGGFPIAVPAGGYLWDRAKEAGVSYRSYGEWVANPKRAGDPTKAKAKSLEGHFDPYFWSFDTAYPDVKRAARFISELQRFEREGEMPRLQIVRLPNDHTSGTSPGKHTPTAQVADNDLAFGQLVEAVSKSKFWPQTAIFVVEDDAQNGPDHVDAHRTIAFAISPYIRRGSRDSTMYSTTSMLRTMELLLGLKPMSQFDAAAMPMFASFQKTPDLRPYAARPANVDLEEKNLRTAYGAKESSRMNFAREDAVDDLRLNEVIWRSIKGADSPMPAPIRAAFVFPEKKKLGKRDDDD
ncbi:MAG: alkaline phosphatase family protein [Chthoniobacteraceae bacterium]